jgi:phosphatidylserine synthase
MWLVLSKKWGSIVAILLGCFQGLGQIWFGQQLGLLADLVAFGLPPANLPIFLSNI